MADNALRVSPTQDSTRTICDVTLVYADGDTAYRELQIGTSVRNWRCGVNPCFGLLSCFSPYPLMCAPPADSLSREVYADNTYKFDALEVSLALPDLVWLDSLAAPDAGRVEIEPAAVEEDHATEPLSIAEAASAPLELLDLRVHGL